MGIILRLYQTPLGTSVSGSRVAKLLKDSPTSEVDKQQIINEELQLA